MATVVVEMLQFVSVGNWQPEGNPRGSNEPEAKLLGVPKHLPTPPHTSFSVASCTPSQAVLFVPGLIGRLLRSFTFGPPHLHSFDLPLFSTFIHLNKNRKYTTPLRTTHNTLSLKYGTLPTNLFSRYD